MCRLPSTTQCLYGTVPIFCCNVEDPFFPDMDHDNHNLFMQGRVVLLSSGFCCRASIPLSNVTSLLFSYIAILSRIVVYSLSSRLVRRSCYVKTESSKTIQ